MDKIYEARSEIRQLKTENRRLRTRGNSTDKRDETNLLSNLNQKLFVSEQARIDAEAKVRDVQTEMRRLEATTAFLRYELQRQEIDRYRLLADIKTVQLSTRPKRQRLSQTVHDRQYSLALSIQ